MELLNVQTEGVRMQCSPHLMFFCLHFPYVLFIVCDSSQNSFSLQQCAVHNQVGKGTVVPVHGINTYRGADKQFTHS
jgi:hypothetical protein